MRGFRDYQVAAPLKLHLFSSHERMLICFRDYQVAAPLKRSIAAPRKRAG